MHTMSAEDRAVTFVTEVTRESQCIIDRSQFSADDLNDAAVRLATFLGADGIAPWSDEQGLSEAGDDAVDYLNDLLSEQGIRGWFYFADNSLFYQKNHDHCYSPFAADWWCGDCKTVTDFCSQN